MLSEVHLMITVTKAVAINNWTLNLCFRYTFWPRSCLFFLVIISLTNFRISN